MQTTYRITQPRCDPLGARRHAQRRAVSDDLTALDERAGRLRTQAGRAHAYTRRWLLERLPVNLDALKRRGCGGHPPELYDAIAVELIDLGYAYLTSGGWLMPSRLEP